MSKESTHREFWTLKYKDFQAVAIGAKDCKAPVLSTIQGDQGLLQIHKPVNHLYITRGMTSEDLALFVSYSGEMKEINDELYTLRRRRVPIIALSSRIESYLAGMSTRTIVIPHLEGITDEKVATFYSQFAFDYILNVIYALIYNGQQDSVQ